MYICGEVNGKNRYGAYVGFRTFSTLAQKVGDSWEFPFSFAMDDDDDYFEFYECATYAWNSNVRFPRLME